MIKTSRGGRRKQAVAPAPIQQNNNNVKYREFPDEASSGFTYEGDGDEQVQFFKDHSNADELISGMSMEERAAFRTWASGRFMHGQQYGDFDNMTREEQKLTRIYDNILDNATLNEGVVVVRRTDAQLVMGAGKHRATLEELQAQEGSIVKSKGCMSTGAASQGLTIGDSRKNVEYKMHIPPGKGAGMWIGDSRINGWGPEQREFMTNRDAAFRVGKTTYDPGRKMYVVDMYYVGHEAHDYGKKGR